MQQCQILPNRVRDRLCVPMKMDNFKDMKFCATILILILLPAFLLQAQTINRDMTVDLEFHDISLKQAMHQISEKYGLRFSYSDSRLNGDQIVTGTYEDVPLMDFLSGFLMAHEISFSLIDDQIVLYPFNANQKNIIKGRVVNQYDGSPIPYANISIRESSKGTATNEDGDFEIALSAFPAELSVSHLAHEKKLVYVYYNQTDLTIQLEPAPRALKEITIKSRRNKNAYYQIVLKAYDKLVRTQGDQRYGKAFYRQKSSRENRFTEIFEIFYDTRFTSSGIQDWAVQEGRYAFQQDKEYDVFLYNKNFTLLSRMFPVLQPATDSYVMPLNREVKKYFDLSLHEIINYENRYVAIINYTPKLKDGKPAPSGQLYIDYEDYSILKITGKFTGTALGIIGFTDAGSNWDKYKLAFEISFIDDQSDNLLLDYITIDHTFDYYYNKNFIGNIYTSSLLTFYEHYTPAGGKRLGGAIDFKSSDVELIDRAGYNPVFWKQNPIVKRTPIEDKLIMDFEQNEAFGHVFMNNDKEVVLMPDSKKTALSEKIITSYEAAHLQDSCQKIFLRLDKYDYRPEEKVNFAAHIFDKWTFRPMVSGSVLTVEVKDEAQRKIISKKYDINNGTAYGQLSLDGPLTPGFYHLEAYTNIDQMSIFKTKISVSPFPLKVTSDNAAEANAGKSISDFTIVAESGTLLAGAPSQIVFNSSCKAADANGDLWHIVDAQGSLVQTTISDASGVGAFSFIPVNGKSYFLISAKDSLQKYPLPQVAATGISIHLSHERSRGIHLDIYQQPAVAKEIFLLSSYQGRVSGIYQTKLNGLKSSIDLPDQYLRGGINELAVLDMEGKILAKRLVYHPTEAPNITLQSVRWKSKRSQWLELVLQVSDADGKPVEANLSAAGPAPIPKLCANCDIRNIALPEGMARAHKINFDKTGDSLYRALDRLLILHPVHDAAREPDCRNDEIQDPGYTANWGMIVEDSLMAEVSVSGGFSSGMQQSKKIKNRKNSPTENESFWFPKLLLDSKGTATIELKVLNKSEKIHVNVQGLSEDGLICFGNLTIDPAEVKAYNK